MKKYILILIGISMVLPAFAFDFSKDNLEIDANLKAEIAPIINEKANTVAEENIQITNVAQNQDNEIISAIKAEMGSALRQINRNTKLRKNIFTRSFVQEQQVQKERYQDMIRQDVPTQIYEYIEMNFDLPQIKNPWATCIYHNETIVEVRFTFAQHYVIVYYDYNDEQNHIKHIVD